VQGLTGKTLGSSPIALFVILNSHGYLLSLGRPQGRPFSCPKTQSLGRRVLGRPAPSLPVEHLFDYFLFDLFVKVAQKNILKFVHIYY
jgi:hypothetical protein